MENKIITIRNVYGKVKEVHFQPCRQENGTPWPFVKPVRYDSNGNSELILSDKERNDPNNKYFIPEDMDIVEKDGTTFDLSDPLQFNIWTSIKNSDLFAPSRDARNDKGELFIDGNKQRYGIAEFYIEIPGEASERSVSKKQKITKAWTYIEHDSKNGRLTKCKILGKYMENSPDSDVEDYLYQIAEKNPEQVINLYESKDIALKLLVIDAKQKGIIKKVDGMFVYADTILGATDEAIIITLKMPTNKTIYEQLAYETYPEYAPIRKIEGELEKAKEGPKRSSSKSKE